MGVRERSEEVTEGESRKGNRRNVMKEWGREVTENMVERKKDEKGEMREKNKEGKWGCETGSQERRGKWGKKLEASCFQLFFFPTFYEFCFLLFMRKRTFLLLSLSLFFLVLLKKVLVHDYQMMLRKNIDNLNEEIKDFDEFCNYLSINFYVSAVRFILLLSFNEFGSFFCCFYSYFCMNIFVLCWKLFLSFIL